MRHRQYQSPLPITTIYRDLCASYSKRFRSLYVGRGTSFTWEAFGLGSDLRNANQPIKIIEARTGYHHQSFLRNWPKYFPELADNPLPSPFHEDIVSDLSKGLSQKTVASRHHVTKGIVSGIAYRLRKANEKCKTPTHPKNPAFDPGQSPSKTPGHIMSIAISSQPKKNYRQ